MSLIRSSPVNADGLPSEPQARDAPGSYPVNWRNSSVARTNYLSCRFYPRRVGAPVNAIATWTGDDGDGTAADACESRGGVGSSGELCIGPARSADYCSRDGRAAPITDTRQWYSTTAATSMGDRPCDPRCHMAGIPCDIDVFVPSISPTAAWRRCARAVHGKPRRPALRWPRLRVWLALSAWMAARLPMGRCRRSCCP